MGRSVPAPDPPPAPALSPKQQALAEVLAACAVAAAKHRDWPSALWPVTAAQWALESFWGTAMPKDSQNPFGVKAAHGQPYVEALTWEWENGKKISKTQLFRKYANFAEALEDHGRLIVTGAHSGKLIYAAALAHADDPHAFARALTGVYATDPTYGDKLCRLLDGGILAAWEAL
jgi:flagellum-specific peptidoglycan hydrolase FlgJ